MSEDRDYIEFETPTEFLRWRRFQSDPYRLQQKWIVTRHYKFSQDEVIDSTVLARNTEQREEWRDVPEVTE